jgi:hypothetical protein
MTFNRRSEVKSGGQFWRVGTVSTLGTAGVQSTPGPRGTERGPGLKGQEAASRVRGACIGLLFEGARDGHIMAAWRLDGGAERASLCPRAASTAHLPTTIEPFIALRRRSLLYL